MGNKSSTTQVVGFCDDQGGPSSNQQPVLNKEHEELRQALAEIGFHDDQRVLDAIQTQHGHFNKCVRYLMEYERKQAARHEAQRRRLATLGGIVLVGAGALVAREWRDRGTSSVESPMGSCAPEPEMDHESAEALESLALCAVHTIAVVSLMTLVQICLDRPKCVMAMPCRHVVWCSSCKADRFQSCPICTQPLSHSVQLQLSKAHPSSEPTYGQMRELVTCYKCSDRVKSVVYNDCGHSVLCLECYQSEPPDRCEFCRAKIDSTHGISHMHL
eukprot:TRINITY_DN332_c0_g1_i2.p1 TRINITY_DN332_c0_g1~~TRINITY_DN332_c0_g1_i2.p1  ORF type:complete len:273 (+),score=25.43 TRINITY_DN332_c0_g1_i2:189-1007(+)